MKNILLLLTFFVTSFAFAQAPPPPSMPTNDNKVLIDELIKVTEFENYFTEYCKNKVEQAAKESNWEDGKTQQIIESIKFKYFSNSIYNAFAVDSKENLSKTIILFKSMNENRKDSILKMIPINAMIQFNLDGFAKSIIEGKYIINK